MSTHALHGTCITCITCIVVSLLFGPAAPANAATDKKDTTRKTWAVDASHGTYSDAIPIEVPAFRGITPALALTYARAGTRSTWTRDPDPGHRSSGR